MSKHHHRPTIKHAELSGKFSASGKELRAALDSLVDDHGRNVITVTEVAFLGAALKAWAEEHGWHLHHPKHRGKNECAILSAFPLDKRRAWRLTPLTLRTGRTAPIFLTAARIKGGPWIGVWHSPAHNGGLRTTGKFAWPTRVYVSALAGLHAARMRMRGSGVLLTGDFNLDLVRTVIQDRFRKVFPHLNWAMEKGQKPTEGGRVIDGVLTNLHIVRRSWTIVKRFAGLDHRAVCTDLA